MRTGRRQKIKAVDHGPADHAIVRTRDAETRCHGHAWVTVEGERVERTVGEEAVGDRLIMRVAVIAARTRGYSGRVTGSFG